MAITPRVWFLGYQILGQHFRLQFFGFSGGSFIWISIGVVFAAVLYLYYSASMELGILRHQRDYIQQAHKSVKDELEGEGKLLINYEYEQKCSFELLIPIKSF